MNSVRPLQCHHFVNPQFKLSPPPPESSPYNLPWRHRVGVEVQLNLFLLTSALDGSGWSTRRPGRFTPRNDQKSLYRRLGGLQGLSRRVRELSPRTGVRFSGRPARSKSLNRLRSSFMFCWPCISIHIYVTNSNFMHYLSSVYFVNQPLHVSGIFVAHHQEV